MHFTRREFIGVAGALTLSCVGCLDRSDEPTNSTLDVVTGLDGEVIDLFAPSGVPEAIHVDFSELQVWWEGVADSVRGVVIGIDSQYGVLVRQFETGNWSDTSTYDPNVAPVSLLEETESTPEDFSVGDEGETQTFELELEVMVELLDRDFEQIASRTRGEQVLLRVTHGDPPDDGQAVAMFLVQDDGGTPVEGATVRVYDEDGLVDGLFRNEAAEGFTNAAGFASTTIENGVYVVEAEHEDVGIGTSEVEIAGQDRIIRVMLEPFDGEGDAGDSGGVDEEDDTGGGEDDASDDGAGEEDSRDVDEDVEPEGTSEEVDESDHDDADESGEDADDA